MLSEFEVIAPAKSISKGEEKIWEKEERLRRNLYPFEGNISFTMQLSKSCLVYLERVYKEEIEMSDLGSHALLLLTQVTREGQHWKFSI